jgi:hypothetical protein
VNDQRYLFDVATDAMNQLRRARPELTGPCNWMIEQIAAERVKLVGDQTPLGQEEKPDVDANVGRPALFDPNE